MSELERISNLALSTLNRFRLDGKIAMVVGASQGLGQGMALALAAAGADVCAVGLGAKNLEDTASAVSRLGRKSLWIEADMTKEENVDNAVSRAAETLGGIDILVNSQGISHLQPSAEFDAEAWQRVMDVNLKSIFLSCKHAGRIMLQKGKGKIINISSVRSFQGRAEDLAYAPSKGAVNQLTRSLAIEWGVKGINVNAIAPVFTLTPMNRSILDDPEKKNWVLGRIPLRRLGEVDDLFGPVVFLASEASNFVNGHILVVDGGWIAA
ncbi:MAG TPA: glucose 1-dehydrogenase [Thermodesulfobacteriota bacterium]|nr:glucose 1-dehydrogenase [Thermodesulfobacteriota bacterium]